MRLLCTSFTLLKLFNNAEISIGWHVEKLSVLTRLMNSREHGRIKCSAASVRSCYERERERERWGNKYMGGAWKRNAWATINAVSDGSGSISNTSVSLYKFNPKHGIRAQCFRIPAPPECGRGIEPATSRSTAERHMTPTTPRMRVSRGKRRKTASVCQSGLNQLLRKATVCKLLHRHG